MTIFDDIALGTADEPDEPPRPFSEVYARIAAEVRGIVNDREREMWAVAFHPLQDAPALGYMPSLREYVGAVPWTDEAISDAFYVNRPPGVMLPSEVTDAVAKWWLRP